MYIVKDYWHEIFIIQPKSSIVNLDAENEINCDILQIGNHPSTLDDPIYHQIMLFMDGQLYVTELSNQIHPYDIAKGSI